MQNPVTKTLLNVAAFTAIAPAFGAMAQSDSGYRIVRARAPYARLEERLKDAIAKNGMNFVNRASASDGAKGRDVIIRGDAVIGVFRNDFAVRMLEANVDAGIEAPIRLHLVEEADGSTSIRYYRPSAVFGRYQGDKIRALATELDAIFEKIVKEAAEAP